MNSPHQTGVPRSKEDIAQLTMQWEQSGISKKAFAAQHGLNYHTFVGWTCGKGQRRRRDKKSFFIPVPVTQGAAKIFAEIHFSNGSRIVFHQAVGAEYFQSFLK
jgi:hypothetical protein